jgi:hypothetical protein
MLIHHKKHKGKREYRTQESEVRMNAEGVYSDS